MINQIKKIIILALFLYLPCSSMAWGVLGHRIVGQIADAYLTKQTKKEIYKILGTESIAMASNWPDFIKSDSAYDYLDTWHYINLRPGLTKTELKNYKVEEEVMKLTFNDKIFDSIYDKNILEEVVYTIGKSVMENYDVKKVIFYVDDKEIVEY